MGIYTTRENRPVMLPVELNNVRVVDWTWPNISNFLARL